MSTAIIEPTVPQFNYITSEARFPAMVAGFGAGKSEAAVNRAILGALRYPTLDRGFYLPTYDLVRTIAWPRFESRLEQMGIAYKLYKSPLNYIQIHGCGKIIFRSMEAPERLVGYEHADADADELDILKPDHAAEVWRRILSRNRQKKPDGKPNTIGVTTTPEGFRFVYETWYKAPKPGYEIIRAPTWSNTHLGRDYIENLRQDYPRELLRAYLGGLFVNMESGTVYSSFCRTESHSDAVAADGEALHVGMDFNVQNMSAVIHVIREGCPIAVDEISGARDTPTIIRMLKERFDGHKITVYPDASGGNRNTTDALVNDLALLKQAGFSVRVDKKNPRVRARVTAVNSALMNAKSERKYKVNTVRCPDFTECLEKQAYDKHGDPDKSGGLDHLNDAAGYFIAQKYPLRGPSAKRMAWG